MWSKRRKSLFSQLLSVPFALPPDDGLPFDLDEIYPRATMAKPIPVPRAVPWVPEALSAGRENLDAYIFDNDTVRRKVFATLCPCVKAAYLSGGHMPPNQKALVVCALLAWPAMIPNKFVRLIKRMDKKSLLIMAYYYATMHYMDLSDIWWMAGRPLVMCKALCKLLGDEYGPYLQWPISVIELDRPDVALWQPDLVQGQF